MEGSPVDIAIFAPLAPILGVLLFWFIQLLFIESQKYLLIKIRKKHEPLCRFTNFLGILFQTICHALGYTVTKHGISEFYVNINYGKVKPKKDKQGVFEWVSNVFLFIGPFFLPAGMLLICLLLILTDGFDTTTPSHLINLKYTFGGQLTAFGINLYNFSKSFFGFLLNIDLLHPGHIGFLLLMIFLGLGIRPSHIGEKKKSKVDMIYDLKNIWNLITQKPLYIVLIFIFSYLFFYISLFLDQNWYVFLFSVFGWLSIISIASLLITHLLILFIKTTDNIEGKKQILPFIMLPFSYVLMRIPFLYVESEFRNTICLFVMLFATFILTITLVQDENTNKFKTRIRIKLFKRKSKGEKDEGRRSAKK